MNAKSETEMAKEMKLKNIGTKRGMIVTPRICRGIFCKKITFLCQFCKGVQLLSHVYYRKQLIFKKIGKDYKKLSFYMNTWYKYSISTKA